MFMSPNIHKLVQVPTCRDYATMPMGVLGRVICTSHLKKYILHLLQTCATHIKLYVHFFFQSGSGDGSDCTCVVCGECFVDSKAGEIWVECQCSSWAHEECTPNEGNIYVCINCGGYNSRHLVICLVRSSQFCVCS